MQVAKCISRQKETDIRRRRNGKRESERERASLREQNGAGGKK